VAPSEKEFNEQAFKTWAPTDGIHLPTDSLFMLIRRRDSVVWVWAPAKINLYLEVLGRREDGYHELATLMVAINLYDTLEFEAAPPEEIHLHCDCPDLPGGPQNLVWRAAVLLRQEAGSPAGVRIRLWKRIPHAAGLAGGSSDAAATLAGLNQLWQLGYSREQLKELAAELGSDVPFFFAAPAAWCTGRGEKVEAVPVGRPLPLVLACPHEGLATAQVFAHLNTKQEPVLPDHGARLREALAQGNREELGRLLSNDLQPVAERLCPAVSRLISLLRDLGPVGQRMSGSGSAVFALCRDDGEAHRIARALHHLVDEKEQVRIFVVRSCD
jgi:4-diphosphocytidyl-2-C-methyl-D-erythritol kinase